MADFLNRSGADSVRVRSPHIGRLHEILSTEGLSAHRDGDDLLLVRGASAAQVGELAASHGLALHELASQQVSLEEAYMNLTQDAVDYRAGGARP
jgi:ABC-2 type transport system ATP-binding protein